MHDDDGLRFDLVDERAPVLSGNIGFRTHQVSAWFDNVVVLPLDSIPRPGGIGSERE